MKHLLMLIGSLMLIVISYSSYASETTPNYQRLLDKDQIVDTVNQLFISTDNRDWDRVKTIFASQVEFDMTLLAGGTPSTLSAQQIVDAWDNGLKALQAIHHQVGNFIVEVNGDEAKVFCYGTATHYLPNKTNRNTRTFVGSYDFLLKRVNASWKIAHFTYHSKYVDGNLKLEESL